MKNYTIAQSVTRHSEIQVILRNVKESMLSRDWLLKEWNELGKLKVHDIIRIDRDPFHSPLKPALPLQSLNILQTIHFLDQYDMENSLEFTISL